MKIYNKLVRDNIPSVIAESGKTCYWHIAPQEERLKYLLAKVKEEAEELTNANDEDMLEEIADLTEVVRSLLKELDICTETLTEAQIEKRKQKGGFDNFIILEAVD